MNMVTIVIQYMSRITVLFYVQFIKVHIVFMVKL